MAVVGLSSVFFEDFGSIPFSFKGSRKPRCVKVCDLGHYQGCGLRLGSVQLRFCIARNLQKNSCISWGLLAQALSQIAGEAWPGQAPFTGWKHPCYSDRLERYEFGTVA